jgi:hypothetical protein
VCIGAMMAQRESVERLIFCCRAAGKTILAGGPLFTSAHDEFPGVQHFVLWRNAWALGYSSFRLGVVGRERVHYWRLLLWTLFHRPPGFTFSSSRSQGSR